MLLFGITRAHVFHPVHQQESHHGGTAIPDSEDGSVAAIQESG
jgi:hypothetical protein